MARDEARDDDPTDDDAELSVGHSVDEVNGNDRCQKRANCWEERRKGREENNDPLRQRLQLDVGDLERNEE
jgi:hypothetical protein